METQEFEDILIITDGRFKDLEKFGEKLEEAKGKKKTIGASSGDMNALGNVVPPFCAGA